MRIVGVLLADPKNGTAIKVDADQTEWGPGISGSTLRVMWPPGFAARRRIDGEVEVLRAGNVVVTMGRHVALSIQFQAAVDASRVFPACDGQELP
jgi:hypothetical protein